VRRMQELPSARRLFAACSDLYELRVYAFFDFGERQVCDSCLPELEAMTNLRVLRLIHCSIRKAGMTILKRPISAMKQLCVLDLSHNELGIGGVEALLSLLPRLPKLESLILSGSLMSMSRSKTDRVGVTLLAKLAGACSSSTAKLTNLSLRRNDLGNLQRDLGHALGAAVCLTSLDLSYITWNPYHSPIPFSEQLASVVGRVTSLRRLNLRNNRIAECGLGVMCSHWRALVSLSNLNLSWSTEVSAEGCRMLVDFVLAMPALEVVNVEGTLRAGGAEAKYAADALKGRVVLEPAAGAIVIE